MVVAFDVIETLFPLDPIRARLDQAGQPGALLELWFARILRDAIALTQPVTTGRSPRWRQARSSRSLKAG